MSAERAVFSRQSVVDLPSISVKECEALLV